MFSISLNGIYTNNMNGKKMFGWDLGKKKNGVSGAYSGSFAGFQTLQEHVDEA